MTALFAGAIELQPVPDTVEITGELVDSPFSRKYYLDGIISMFTMMLSLLSTITFDFDRNHQWTTKLYENQFQ